jgi:bifunctional DNA-binding transcriptional regulator/antitoxin component of YhaV-PrlF toxin-antitoxin module
MERMLTSKLTEFAPTMIPTPVLDALGLRPGVRIGHVVTGDVLRRIKVKPVAPHGPARAFLALLQRDIVARPERVVGFPAELLERMSTLSVGVPVDHIAPIDGPVAI